AVKGRTMRRQLTIVAPSWPTTWTARAWCWLAGLAVLTLLAGPVAAEPSRTTSCPVIDTFQSAGKPITVERFEPEAAGKYPAFLLLHAVDGMAKPYGDKYRTLSGHFAVRGYVVVLVHYFDRTGATEEELAPIRAKFLRYPTGKFAQQED